MAGYSLAEKTLPAPTRNAIERLIDGRNLLRAGRKVGVCASDTRKRRREIILMTYAQLWQDGFQLRDPNSLGGRHIEHVAARWLAEGCAASTLATRISVLRTLSVWLKKRGMVKDLDFYYPDGQAKRTTVAKVNKAWHAAAVDPMQLIAQAHELDPLFALYLTLQYRFGLRVKESIEFRPMRSITSDRKGLEIFEGTKGGRRRFAPIDSSEKREAYEWARRVAEGTNTGRIRWPTLTFRQAQRKFYYLAEQMGITKAALGVTAHGLRHEFSQSEYREIVGKPTPIEGGALPSITWTEHRDATQTVSGLLGHSRLGVCATYYGSYGHALRPIAQDVHYRFEGVPHE